MALAEVKDRISAVDRQRLADAVATSGDPVRGWWACVGSSGRIELVHDAGGHLDAGLHRADAVANEAVAVAIVQVPTVVSRETRALIGLLCGANASQVTPAQPSDAEWMRQCAAIRDAQVPMRDRLGDAIDIAEPTVAATVGLLLGLAARRTPAILIGAHAHAAAVIGQRQSVGAATWWRSAFAEADPLVQRAQDRLLMEPWITVGTPLAGDTSVDVLVAVLTELQR